MTSPLQSFSTGTWNSSPSRQSQAFLGCLPNAFRRSFFERSRDCFTRKRPTLRHQQQTAPGKIDIVPRQPAITTASRASTPIRFSSTTTRRDGVEERALAKETGFRGEEPKGRRGLRPPAGHEGVVGEVSDVPRGVGGGRRRRGLGPPRPNV